MKQFWIITEKGLAYGPFRSEAAAKRNAVDLTTQTVLYIAQTVAIGERDDTYKWRSE